MTTQRTTSGDVEDAAGASNQDPQALRSAMVEGIIARHQQLGRVVPPGVEAALRTVPRHLFAPGVGLEKAYADDVLVTKENERGVHLSSVSAPNVIAGMLGQLDAETGQRVLEIGSGGYNAALLAELVGPEGSVTTMDIDAEVVERARACLDRAGYGRVRTVCADGEYGAAEFAPFDRIIVTVGAWDLPPAWLEQLAEGGRLVVPLRTKGLTRSWALERAEGHLASRSHLMCGFVPMQGAGEHRRTGIALHGEEVTLWLDDGAQVDAAALAGLLTTPRAEAWTGVTRRKGEPFSDQDLWLATTLPGACQLAASQQAVERGLVAPTWRLGTPALLEGTTLAYRAKLRPTGSGEDPEISEFGAYAHGPEAAAVAEHLAAQIRRWHQAGSPAPRLSAHPADTPDAALPEGCVLDKRHTRLVITWPESDR
ncbi:protein-L-isoaspartate(D-aspartate) O-methyltransferase [Lipingzhangella halophila]|uniref:Protein-L-isoaspartate O-methyltransferase n=1 Tax=Lipingzhangella halophila TaxID=1783352 RepID=A0A7W7RFI1_9ACTN|nr:methyltransferase, FxLD system [Lipingzhangella halophila]MBB4930698.1 protein-L-isoaspartate(D-aspartate) O-methyltransferase [Lipingzhangella halophila]